MAKKKKKAVSKAAAKSKKKNTPKSAAQVTKKSVRKAAAVKPPAKKKAAPARAGKAMARTSEVKGRYQGPRLGETVSDFALPATDGEFRLSTHKGQKVVLYFYPKDATPGCTLEGHDFSKLKNDFAAAGAVVMGVSRDDLKSHEKFRAKEGYSVDLIADVNEELCRLFDVIQEKNMYGKKILGVERSTFLIDGEGRLVKEWRKVSVPGHAAEVLESVKTL